MGHTVQGSHYYTGHTVRGSHCTRVTLYKDHTVTDLWVTEYRCCFQSPSEEAEPAAPLEVAEGEESVTETGAIVATSPTDDPPDDGKRKREL